MSQYFHLDHPNGIRKEKLFSFQVRRLGINKMERAGLAFSNQTTDDNGGETKNQLSAEEGEKILKNLDLSDESAVTCWQAAIFKASPSDNLLKNDLSFICSF